MPTSPMPTEISFIRYTAPGRDRNHSSSRHILLHPDRVGWLRVNDAGLEIANHLDQGLTSDDIVAHLVLRYGISDTMARKDVSAAVSKLKAHGFALPHRVKDEPRVPRLRSLFIHLTQRCNLACPHCYAADGYQQDVHLETATVIGLIDALADGGGRSITLSGGEPLVHPHIEKILDHAASRLSVRLLTNGLLIDRHWASFLAERKIHVQVSLDGSEEEIHDAVRGEGSYQKTIEAIRRLQAAGAGENINLCTTIMPGNRDDLFRIITIAEGLGIPLVRFLPLRSKGRAAEKGEHAGEKMDYEGFFEAIHELRKNKSVQIELSCGLSGFLLALPDEREDDIWCPVGRMLVVDATGGVYPCVLMMEEAFRLGSIHESSLRELIGSERMADLCRTLSRRKTEIDDCAPCTWRGLCQGGCMGQALDHKSTIWAVDDFCGYRKKSYERAFNSILAGERTEDGEKREQR